MLFIQLAASLYPVSWGHKGLAGGPPAGAVAAAAAVVVVVAVVVSMQPATVAFMGREGPAWAKGQKGGCLGGAGGEGARVVEEWLPCCCGRVGGWARGGGENMVRTSVTASSEYWPALNALSSFCAYVSGAGCCVDCHGASCAADVSAV